jgi:hypothetical protein
MFGSLRELRDVAHDHGLGAKYYLLTGGAAAALMIALFAWGHLDKIDEDEVIAPPAALSPNVRPAP